MPLLEQQETLFPSISVLLRLFWQRLHNPCHVGLPRRNQKGYVTPPVSGSSEQGKGYITPCHSEHNLHNLLQEKKVKNLTKQKKLHN